MNNNLDVWAIQYYPEELKNALSQIKYGINIIYSNVKCNLKIGNQKINTRQFDTILYNEESDILIMLMRDGNVTKEDIIKYLEENNKRYVEVTFDYEIFDYKEGDNIPELWFSREKYVLNDALVDSISKGITSCEYYPTIKSELKLGFLSKYDNYINLDNRYFKGLIKLEDKIVLIINQKDNINNLGESRNMNKKEILETIRDNNIYCKLIFDKEPQILEENFSKKLIKINRDITKK